MWWNNAEIKILDEFYLTSHADAFDQSPDWDGWCVTYRHINSIPTNKPKIKFKKKSLFFLLKWNEKEY